MCCMQATGLLRVYVLSVSLLSALSGTLVFGF